MEGEDFRTILSAPIRCCGEGGASDRTVSPTTAATGLTGGTIGEVEGPGTGKVLEVPVTIGHSGMIAR